MEVVNKSFQVVREMLSSVVPPCTATIDSCEKYEVRAVKESIQTGKVSDILFGYLVRHSDSITVGFDEHLSEEHKKELFSAFLIQKMNHQNRIRIHDIDHQTHVDLQQAVQSLLRYYTSMNWV